MALSFEQYPVDDSQKLPVITNWTPLIGYMLYRNASIAALFYYKLVLEVYTGTAVVTANLIGKIKQRRNGYSVDVTSDYARAFFDLRELANTQLVDTVFDQNQTGIPFQTIHKIGVNVAAEPFSFNGDSRIAKTQIIALTVRGLENYSDAANTSPSDDTSDAITDTLYYMQASLPLLTARNTTSTYIQSTAFQPYQASASTDLFLSDLETAPGDYGLRGYINYVQDTDYHTVAFLNDATNFTSDLDYIQIAYYDSSGSLLNDAEYIANIAANGGIAPDDGSLANDGRLLYFGCGPGNLEAQSDNTDARPSNNSGWAYYTIRGTSTTNTNPAAATPETDLYYFIKQDGSCKGFKVRRLAWRNSLGCYDYFNFKMKSSQTITVERNNFNTLIGRYNASKWYYNNTMRGKTTRQTTAVVKETLNTDWISQDQAVLLEKLIVSTNVYIIENADTTYTEGVIITDSSFIKKTTANDGLIQYTINIEYANSINTNS